MEYKTLLKADFKRHKGSLAGIFLLILLVSAALCTILSAWTNSESYIREEMKRAGFGTITAWVSGVPDMEAFTASIADLEAVSRVEEQRLIYSDYTVNGQKSDSEGQLTVDTISPNAGEGDFHIPPNAGEGDFHIPPNAGEGDFQLTPNDRYKYFSDNLSTYREEVPEISPGEVYVSPSMISMFDIQIGDEVSFSIARSGIAETFTVKGFYEDPFMGSSMIGMKGFLINETDYLRIADTIQLSGIDALARSGAMLHIFQENTSTLTVSELNILMNENTNLPQYAEFVHSESAVAGFMLILQNAFSGLLGAFVVVLLFVLMVVLGHSISSSIEADYVNMGILKTVGFTGRKLRRIQMVQYLSVILLGMLGGFVMSVFLSRFVSSVTLTITGIRIPSELPVAWYLLSCAVIALILAGFISLKTGKINGITPMKAIRGATLEPRSGKSCKSFSHAFGGMGPVPINGNHLEVSLAFRQMIAGKRMFAGACIVAVLLVFVASVTGRMDSWLGADGQGMMEAFNPADHDIGVQVQGEHTAKEAEQTVLSYTGITDSYLLAMLGVSVNGIDYTANVISDPERFHIIEGRTSLADNEIVLTEFVASDLGVAVGDTVTVRADKGSGEYTVSGIYTCANDMGDNVGMSREGYLNIGNDNSNIWCSHYFLADASRKAIVTEALDAAYGGDVHVHENTWPGLYGIISAMKALLVFLYVMVTAFILVVTIMTGSKILAAEKRDMGIYKALGFTSGQLRRSFALRFGMTAILGAAIGSLLASILTDPLVSAVMKMAGISNFSSRPSVANTLLPAAVVILLFTGFAYAASRSVRKTDLTVLITE